MGFEKFFVSDGFDLEISQVQNGTKVLLLDMGVWLQNLKKEFPNVKAKASIKLEQLDLTYSLPGLAEAPFPAMGDLDTRAERSTALLRQWRDFASVGLRFLVAAQGGFWRTAGTLPLQNHGAENWQPLLQPFLTTTSEVFLMGERAKLAVEVINLGSGLLKTGDRLTIRGGFLAEITAWEQPRQPITRRQNIAFDLLDGVPLQILPWNQDRQYLYLSNAGNSNIYFAFGTTEDLTRNATISNGKVTQANGLLLTPGGTANFASSSHIEASPISVVAIGAAGRVTLLEGS